jgi:hypothetical protein
MPCRHGHYLPKYEIANKFTWALSVHYISYMGCASKKKYQAGLIFSAQLLLYLHRENDRPGCSLQAKAGSFDWRK